MPSRNSHGKTAMSPGPEEFVGSSNAHIHEVVKAAEEDLRQLIRQRADIVKLIGAIKQTIVPTGSIRELYGFGELNCDQVVRRALAKLKDERVAFAECSSAYGGRRAAFRKQACRLPEHLAEMESNGSIENNNED